MNRPYIVCHMLTALDGKITGPFMAAPQMTSLFNEYERIHNFYKSSAWLCGRVTLEENFTLGHKPEIIENLPQYPKEDFVAQTNEKYYVVSADPSGKLGWKSNYLEYEDRPRAHIIEILTNKAPDSYISYLRHYNISYIFAGTENLDCTIAAQKLKQLFNIDILMLEGGGFINWSFLQEGLVDELSLLIAPIADGDTKSVTLFEKASYLTDKAPVAFKITSIEQTQGDGVWLRYKVQN